jgi:uncharacterized protein (UPF0332 family)
MMNDTIIKYWIEKANEDIGSALDNFSAGRLQNAVRDAYFACFHAVAALLFKEGQTFKKHKEVRSALHRDLIRVGKINPSWGKHYDWLFENRQKADYRPLVNFDREQVQEIIDQTSAFLREMKRLVLEDIAVPGKRANSE